MIDAAHGVDASAWRAARALAWREIVRFVRQRNRVVGSIGTHAVNQSLYAKMPYDTHRDFIPITLLAEVGLLVVVNPNLPVNTIPELVAYAKTKPEGLSYGSQGVGTGGHLLGVLFATGLYSMGPEKYLKHVTSLKKALNSGMFVPLSTMGTLVFSARLLLQCR